MIIINHILKINFSNKITSSNVPLKYRKGLIFKNITWKAKILYLTWRQIVLLENNKIGWLAVQLCYLNSKRTNLLLCVTYIIILIYIKPYS